VVEVARLESRAPTSARPRRTRPLQRRPAPARVRGARRERRAERPDGRARARARAQRGAAGLVHVLVLHVCRERHMRHSAAARASRAPRYLAARARTSARGARAGRARGGARDGGGRGRGAGRDDDGPRQGRVVGGGAGGGRGGARGRVGGPRAGPCSGARARIEGEEVGLGRARSGAALARRGAPEKQPVAVAACACAARGGGGGARRRRELQLRDPVVPRPVRVAAIGPPRHGPPEPRRGRRARDGARDWAAVPVVELPRRLRL
jgi:hypothetical protein